MEPRLSALGEAVRDGDPDRFEAALFADEATRERLFTLYALNLEAARAPWRSAEPQVVAIRLRFWLDTLAEAYDGKSARAHELAEPLNALIRAAKPPRAPLEGLVEARLREPDPTPFESLTETLTHLDATAGATLRLAAFVCAGGETAEQAQACAALGRAQGAAALLAATPELAARGRLWIGPPEGAPPIEAAALFRGETREDVRRAVRALAEAGLAALANARSRRAEVAPAAAPACLAAWRTATILRRARAPDVDVFRDFGPESPFRRRAGLLWRGLTGRW